MTDINSIPERVQAIYAECTPEEQEVLKTILQELADEGYSKTYEDVWLADYKEIPVDINTFLNSDTYLGRTNRNGEAVYPFWRKALNEFFGAGNKYWEWISSGATRIGKSTTGVSAGAYCLYRMMCLKDPQKFFNKKDVSKFSFLFFNITKDLAKGVGFREFNDTLKESPWFNAHGTFSNSEQNFYYIPEGGKIVIDYGSDASHGLGQQVFCLVGETKIMTDAGPFTLKELDGCSVNVQQLYNDSLIYVPAIVEKIKDTHTTIRVTLEDGTVLEGTPDHKILLTDGTYKSLGELTINDELYSMEVGDE